MATKKDKEQFAKTFGAPEQKKGINATGHIRFPGFAEAPKLFLCFPRSAVGKGGQGFSLK
jgi:hypothetical protein